MAALYAAAFPAARPWTAAEFSTLLTPETGFLISAPKAFAIGRVVADEAELITLAVAPERRRHGLGGQLLSDFEAMAKTRGATRAFLEVAADNIPARALYHAANWCESGRRKGYYKRANRALIDALLLEKQLT